MAHRIFYCKPHFAITQNVKCLIQEQPHHVCTPTLLSVYEKETGKLYFCRNSVIELIRTELNQLTLLMGFYTDKGLVPLTLVCTLYHGYFKCYLLTS